jgi:methylmalonyl-CoA/ethylmalonyl-CoA epimerase
MRPYTGRQPTFLSGRDTLFNGLDHIAIVVPDVEEALVVWRDQLGFKELFREKVNNNSTLLVHIDLGNTHLQLVQPLTTDHPLWNWLGQNGPGLHHLCLAVDNVAEVGKELLNSGIAPGEPKPHQGTGGKQALFLDENSTGGILVELTGH